MVTKSLNTISLALIVLLFLVTSTYAQTCDLDNNSDFAVVVQNCSDVTVTELVSVDAEVFEIYNDTSFTGSSPSNGFEISNGGSLSITSGVSVFFDNLKLTTSGTGTVVSLGDNTNVTMNNIEMVGDGTNDHTTMSSGSVLTVQDGSAQDAHFNIESVSGASAEFHGVTFSGSTAFTNGDPSANSFTITSSTFNGAYSSVDPGILMENNDFRDCDSSNPCLQINDASGTVTINNNRFEGGDKHISSTGSSSVVLDSNTFLNAATQSVNIQNPSDLTMTENVFRFNPNTFVDVTANSKVISGNCFLETDGQVSISDPDNGLNNNWWDSSDGPVAPGPSLTTMPTSETWATSAPGYCSPALTISLSNIPSPWYTDSDSIEYTTSCDDALLDCSSVTYGVGIYDGSWQAEVTSNTDDPFTVESSFPNSENYYLRSLVGNAIVYSASFEVDKDGKSLGITAPGDYIVVGNTINIDWTADDTAITPVKIELLCAGCSDEQTIISNTTDNPYSWTIPSVERRTDYQFKISSVDYPFVSAISNQFEIDTGIKEISVDAPSAEYLYDQESFTITWEVTSGTIDNFDIELVCASSCSPSTIATQQSGTSLPWTVSVSSRETDYQFKVSASDYSVSATSNQFEIDTDQKTISIDTISPDKTSAGDTYYRPGGEVDFTITATGTFDDDLVLNVLDGSDNVLQTKSFASNNLNPTLNFNSITPGTGYNFRITSFYSSVKSNKFGTFEFDVVKSISFDSTPSSVSDGDVPTISWSTTGNVGDLDLTITPNSGSGELVSTTVSPPTSSYDWNVDLDPNNFDLGDYTITIQSQKDWSPEVKDTATVTINGDKTISEVEIDPASLENDVYSYSGQTITVTWEHAKFAGGTVDISLVDGPASTSIPVQIGISVDQRTYSVSQDVTLPNIDPPGDYKVEVNPSNANPATSSTATPFDEVKKEISAFTIQTDANPGNWYRTGSTITLTWSESGIVGPLELELRDSQSNVLDSVSGGLSNSFDYTIPGDLNRNANVRLVLSSTEFDFLRKETNQFEIDEDKSLTFGAITPDQLVYSVGQEITIDWSKSGFIGNDITFTLKSSSSGSAVIDTFPVNDLSATFDLSDEGLGLGTGYSIELEASEASTYTDSNLKVNSKTFEISGDESISDVQIVSLDEYLIAGETGVELSWEAGEFSSNNVSIVLQLNGENVTSIESGYSNSPGSNTLTFTVPSEDQLDGRNDAYVIRVIPFGGSQFSGETDPFEIDLESKSISITAPEANAFWEIGNARDITWDTTGYIGPVDIVISTADDSNTADIIRDAPGNEGQYTWTVKTPNNTDGMYTVFINATDYSNLNDESPQFEISPPASFVIDTPLSQVDRSYLIDGDNVDIHWSSIGRMEYAKIDLLRDGTEVSTIANVSNSEGDNTVSWSVTLPSSQRSDQFQLSVTGVNVDDIIVATSEMFEIDTEMKNLFSVQLSNSSVKTNQDVTFSWSTTGFCGSLSIELKSLQTQETYSINTGKPASDGDYQWAAQLFNGEEDGEFTIIITSEDYSFLEAESEPFTLELYRNIEFEFSPPQRGYFLPNDEITITTFAQETGVSIIDIVLRLLSTPNTQVSSRDVINEIELRSRADLSAGPVSASIPDSSELDAGEYDILIRGSDYQDVSQVSGSFSVDVESKSLQIQNVTVDNIQPGSEVFLSWTTTGTIETVEIRLESNATVIEGTSQQIPNTGSATLSIPSDLNEGQYTIVLDSPDFTEVKATQSLSVIAPPPPPQPSSSESDSNSDGEPSDSQDISGSDNVGPPGGDGGGGSNTGAIVGGVIGGIVGLAVILGIVGVIIYFVAKRRSGPGMASAPQRQSVQYSLHDIDDVDL
eukprot:gb/GECH01011975.1/.p1 GENE.gb/GECH01011975.1/~~gb/GECH01011975.1/.p1  ORF type:complete len:1850 (+),score=309.30 gb/GECH01011975.1/:1-5550(+)